MDAADWPQFSRYGGFLPNAKCVRTSFAAPHESAIDVVDGARSQQRIAVG